MLINSYMHTRTKGNIGENIACKFLEKEGFMVIGRNYLRKWGELDIIAQKDSMIHFFEVKSVSASDLSGSNIHQPEDNVHGLKTKRLRRIVETYLDDKGGGLDREFQFHVLCIYMNAKTRTARVKWLKNIIL